jgi:hypothetical protein
MSATKLGRADYSERMVCEVFLALFEATVHEAQVLRRAENRPDVVGFKANKRVHL